MNGMPNCLCGIHCICTNLNRCDACEELCQCHAYRLIQSVQHYDPSDTIYHDGTTTTHRQHEQQQQQPQTQSNHHHLHSPTSSDTWKIEVLVQGMTCSMCSQAVDAAIRKSISNLSKHNMNLTIDISLTTDIVTIEWTELDRIHSDDSTIEVTIRCYIDTIRKAITDIGYTVQNIQTLRHPGMNTDEESPHPHRGPVTTTTTADNNDMNNNTMSHVEDRWQQYRQRQMEKVQQRRCAFVVAMILTLPILTITMIVPYIIPDLFHHQHVVLPYLHTDLELEGMILWILATPVQFICGYEFYKMAWYGFWSGRAGMDLLVAIGTTASYLYALHGVLFHTNHPDSTVYDTSHFFETSTILIVFVLAGKWMQAAAVRHTSDAITQLMSLQTPSAIRIIRSASQHQQQQNVYSGTFNPLTDPYIEEIVSLRDLAVGDMVKVIRGASVPVDGCVLFGEIAVDESMMTGESMPVLKCKGSVVLGGTVCVESSSNASTAAFDSVGAAFIQVTGIGSSTALAKIVNLVQQAQTRAVPIQSFADQISAIFVPTVCAISLLTFFVWYTLCSYNVVPAEWYRNELSEDSVTFSMMFAIACLVISCPCALGLATPTAVMVGTGVGAKCGVLMKGGSALEVASKVNTIIFDKTGTLVRNT
jgi:cation transport ATPase